MTEANAAFDPGPQAPWRILHLEDDLLDRRLVREALVEEGIAAEFTYAGSREEFARALELGKFDLVLSDFTLPGYDGAQAMKLTRSKDPDLPYIFVSGTIGEERAVDSLKSGATDYVLKSHLQRLLPAIRRALREVKERRKLRAAEAALSESAERYRRLFERHPHPMWVYDVESLRFLAVNDAALQNYGYTREEFLAMTILDIRPAEDAPQLRAQLRAMPPVFQGTNAWRHRKKDGAFIDVEITSHELPFAGRNARVVTALDVTERKALEAQLHRANRIESVGRLASGIAHDLNNILTPILIAAGLLRTGQTPEEADNTASTIERSAKRGADLVRQLLMFGRGMGGERGPVQLGRLVHELANMMKETFPKSIEVVVRACPDTWCVRGDTSQLHQVLLNLCVNARDAMPQGGTLTLAADNVHLDENAAAGHSEARAGDYVRLTVADSGSGIPPELRERIFDAFFTTKEVGRGTGLGLSTVLGIVKGHGGFIDLRSEVGHGTTFSVFVPAVADPPKPEAPAAEPAPPIRGHGELVLIVDDEENLRAVLRETLLYQNYRVLEAVDGADALAVFACNPDEIRLVITDLDMPVMDGVALVRGLLRMKPDLPVLVSTGLGSGAVSNGRSGQLEALGIRATLKKPYAAQDVFAAVHGALARG